jgi:hypothetical protein
MQIKRKVIHRSNEPQVSNDKWYFATPLALTTAYPVWQNWWYAIVGSTDTVWTWDSDSWAWEDSWKQYVWFKLTSTITNSWDKISSVLIGTTTYTNTRDWYWKWSSITDWTKTWTITRTWNWKKILSIA